MVIQHQFPADYPAFPVEGDAVYPADPEELAVLLNVALIFLYVIAGGRQFAEQFSFFYG